MHNLFLGHSASHHLERRGGGRDLHPFSLILFFSFCSIVQTIQGVWGGRLVLYLPWLKEVLTPARPLPFLSIQSKAEGGFGGHHLVEDGLWCVSDPGLYWPIQSSDLDGSRIRIRPSSKLDPEKPGSRIRSDYYSPILFPWYSLMKMTYSSSQF